MGLSHIESLKCEQIRFNPSFLQSLIVYPWKCRQTFAKSVYQFEPRTVCVCVGKEYQLVGLGFMCEIMCESGLVVHVWNNVWKWVGRYQSWMGIIVMSINVGYWVIGSCMPSLCLEHCVVFQTYLSMRWIILIKVLQICYRCCVDVLPSQAWPHLSRTHLQSVVTLWSLCDIVPAPHSRLFSDQRLPPLCDTAQHQLPHQPSSPLHWPTETFFVTYCLYLS